MAWADVLDHLGLVPRELGLLHVCLTKVLRSEQRARVEVFLQAAFDPLPATALRLRWVDAGGAALGADASAEVPSLAGGRVLKVTLGLEAPAGGAGARLQLRVATDAVKGKPQRVRPAWKLLATHEAARDVRATDAGGGSSAVLGANLLTLPFGVLVLPSLGQQVDMSTPHRLHAAPPSPEFVEAALVEVEVLALPEPEVVELWREGQPLPEAIAAPLPPPPLPVTATTEERRTCPACGFRDTPSRVCPACGAPWE